MTASEVVQAVISCMVQTHGTYMVDIVKAAMMLHMHCDKHWHVGDLMSGNTLRARSQGSIDCVLEHTCSSAELSSGF